MKNRNRWFWSAALSMAIGAAAAAGLGWTVIASPSPNYQNFLYSVSGISSSDVWAAGYQLDSNSHQATLAEHWDGTAWTVAATPSPGTFDCAPYWQNPISGIYMASSSDVWAVGSQCTNSGSSETLAEHWDGVTWTVVPSPNHPGNNSSYFAAVTGSSSTDVWAAGEWAGGTWPSNGGGTLIEHWDGSAWSIVPSPSPSTHQQYSNFTGISEISPTDIWAVGYLERNSAPFEVPLTEHYNGQSWTTIASPFTPSSDTNQLFGVTAISTDNVWAVGYANENAEGRNGQGLIQHWNGTEWSLVDSPIPGSATSLYGISAASADNVWAVGYLWSPTLVTPVTEVWNGTSWRVVVPAEPGKSAELFASGAVAGNIWAVGAFSGTPGNGLSLAQTFTLKR